MKRRRGFRFPARSGRCFSCELRAPITGEIICFECKLQCVIDCRKAGVRHFVADVDWRETPPRLYDRVDYKGIPSISGRELLSQSELDELRVAVPV